MLEHYLSSDPLKRQQVQQWLTQTDTEVVLNTLIAEISKSSDSELRGLAWVLIRGKLQKSDSTKYLDFLKNTFSPQCLTLLKLETADSARSRQMTTIATIANILAKHGSDWTELWVYIRYLTSETSEHEQRETALRLICSLAEYITLLKLFDSDATSLSQLLRKSLVQEDSPKEKKAAFDAILSIAEKIASYSKGISKIQKIKSDQVIKLSFQDFHNLQTQIRSLVPEIVLVLKFLKQESETGNFFSYQQLREKLEHLAELSSIDPKFLCLNQSVLSELLQIGKDIGTNKNFSLDIRKPALQLTVRLMTDYENASSSNLDIFILENKTNQFFINLIQTSLQEKNLLNEIEDEWCDEPDKENDVISNYDNSLAITLSCLDEFISTSKTKRIESLVCELVDMTLQFISQMNDNIENLHNENIHIESALEILMLLVSKPELIPILPINRVLDLIISLLQNKETHCRVKWWGLCVLCEILNTSNSDSEECYEITCDWQTIIGTLSSVDITHKNKIVLRLKHRLLKTLALVFFFFKTAAPASADSILSHNLLSNVLNQIVIPELHSKDMQTQTLSYALLSSIAMSAESNFYPFYSETMQSLHQTLANLKPNLQDGTEVYELLEAVIDVAKETCKAVGWSTSEKDLLVLCNQTLIYLEYLIQTTKAHNEIRMTVGVLMDALATFASVAGENYSRFYERTLQIILTILRQEENISSQNITLENLGEYFTGQVKYSENIKDGVLRFSGKHDDEVYFELKPDVVDERARTLVTFSEILPCVKRLWLSHCKETCETIIKQLLSPFKMIREPANEVATILVSVLLLGENTSDKTVLESNSDKIPVETVSFKMIFELVQLFSTTMLVFTTGPFTLCHAAETLPHVESLFKDLFEANKKKSINQIEATPLDTTMLALFLHQIFVSFDKIMTACVSNEHKSSEQDTNDLELKETINELEEQEESDEDDDEYDFCDIIYMSIMRCISYLFQTFTSLCVPHFEANLKKSFSALLTASEISISGRVAALYMFASAIEFGKSSLAETVLPVALLYARCNDRSCSLDVQEEDVQRVQAAVYCLGVISQTSPEHFLPHIDFALKTLMQVLSHPYAKQEVRLPAGECAYGSLLKIVLNPNYQVVLENKQFDLQTFLALSQQWFPSQSDLDECRTLTKILIDNVLTSPEQQHPLIKLPSFRKEISRSLTVVFEKAKLDPTYIDDEIRCSQKLFKALELLQTPVA